MFGTKPRFWYIPNAMDRIDLTGCNFINLKDEANSEYALNLGGRWTIVTSF